MGLDLLYVNMSTQTLEINKNAYVAFDATSLRDLIIERLNKNLVFTDQNYIGSNISQINEIIAYSFSTLMFYLNKTSTESMYSEAQLYENINRIVKLINYNPLGSQAASVSFNAAAQGILKGSYTIPRYSYIAVGNVSYSFTSDITFTKNTDTLLETIPSMNNVYRLYQGRYMEYPTYIAAGAENEMIVLAIDDNTIVDHINIDIYVKNIASNIWSKWERVDNIFDHNSRAQVFEVRLNENKRYEFKFGDNINGRKLSAGDSVAIYYISTAGLGSDIGSNALQGKFLSKYNSLSYNEILQDTASNINFLTDKQYSSLLFDNNQSSTVFVEEDSVEDIRNKAPKVFKSQGRLLTEQDYISYISANFGSFVGDVSVKSNHEYLSGYIKYFADIGLASPFLESRVLYNQLNFANSCNFNNVYIFAVPKTGSNTYLMPTQKSAIIDNLTPYKSLTTDVVVSDPVYIAIDIAMKGESTVTVADADFTEIYIEINKYNKKGADAVKSEIRNVLAAYFNLSTLKLGSIINITQIYSDILNIDGVVKMYLQRTDTKATLEGISLLAYNPVYPENDILITTQNIALPYFKYAYLSNIDKIINKLHIINTPNAMQNISV